jgi:hypothetical protein
VIYGSPEEPFPKTKLWAAKSFVSHVTCESKPDAQLPPWTKLWRAAQQLNIPANEQMSSGINHRVGIKASPKET